MEPTPACPIQDEKERRLLAARPAASPDSIPGASRAGTLECTPGIQSQVKTIPSQAEYDPSSANVWRSFSSTTRLIPTAEASRPGLREYVMRRRCTV